MAVETLRPSAPPGDETSIPYQFPDSTDHWDKVDEASPDEGSTYVSNTYNPYLRDLYNLPASSGSGIINKITVYFRCERLANGPCYAKASIKSNTTVTDGTQKTLTASWVPYTQEWATNPADSQPWEWADIDTLQVGVSLEADNFDRTAICTQVYVEVDYTPPGDIDTPAKRRMAAGIVPFHSVIIPDGTIGLKDRMQIACLYSENAVATPEVSAFIPIIMIF